MTQYATLFTNVASETAKLVLCTDGSGYMMRLGHAIGESVEAAYPHFEFSYSSNPADFADALKHKCLDYFFDFHIRPRFESLAEGMNAEDITCLRRKFIPLSVSFYVL